MKNAQITIGTNPVFEMLVSLNRIANGDQIESSYFENAGYTPYQRMADILREITGSLSMFFRQEISFFFSNPICSQLWDLVICEDIRDVDQLFHKFEALSDEDALMCLLSEIAETVYQQEIEGGQGWQGIWSVFADRQAFERRLEECQSISQADKEKALEIFRYPADARQRMARLLERYSQVFAPYIGELEELERAEAERSGPACRANAEEFISNYLKINTGIFASAARIDLIPNAFCEVVTYVNQEEKDWFVVVYGAFISKKRLREKQSEERKQFFKVLSEEKRVEIIKSLALKPAIGSSLAKQVGLTNATASYHLTMLLGLGIVEYERIGQRLHYILNKGMLKDLFEKAYQDLVNHQDSVD